MWRYSRCCRHCWPMRSAIGSPFRRFCCAFGRFCKSYAIVTSAHRDWQGTGFGCDANETIVRALPVPAAGTDDAPLRFSDPPRDASYKLCRPGTAGEGVWRDLFLDAECASDASPVFQHQMALLCAASPPTLMLEFLNQLFNTLNWCISEFSVAMDEFKSASADRRKDTSVVQKKCLVMYELAGNLTRVLEVVGLSGDKALFGE